MVIAVASQNREDSNMARLVLSAYQAICPDGVHLQVAIMSESPFPEKIVEVRNVADCEKALEDYKTEAQATGKPMAISMTIARGERSPPGFKKLKAANNFVAVNL
jgi:hypothetical protein